MSYMNSVFGILLASFIAAFLTFVSKLALIRLVGRDRFDTDTYFHLVYADVIRRNHHKLPRRAPALAMIERYSYPYGFHWACSFLSRDRLERYQALIQVAIKCSVVYTLSVITGLVFLRSSNGQTLVAGYAALSAGLIYGLSPLNRNSNPVSPHDLSLSPRALGVLLSSLGCTVAVFAAAEQRIDLALIAVLLMSITCLTSKFGLQCFVFILPICFAFLRAWRMMLILPSGILVAILISRGYYLYVLEGQVRHLSFYARRIVHEHPSTQQHIFKTPANLLKIIRQVFGRYPLSAWYILVRDPMLRGIALYPLHLLCGLSILAGAHIWRADLWLNALAALWLATLFVGLATFLPWLRFLGEGDRYLEFVGFVPATILVLAILPLISGWMATITILVIVFGVFMIVADLTTKPREHITEDERELWACLNHLAGDKVRAVCLPLREAHTVI
ncbi:MAG: hypothetical protein M3362_23165, partial [Acidobacteriota bacterium]|nr:hypothetical protein [Acidobacteriota bacterium]